METIVATSLIAGVVAGFFMHRSDFCVTAMFRDVFLFRDASGLKILLFMIVLTAVLFHGARALGVIAHYPFPLLGPMSLANALGGVVFGIGMVLAGGCVVGTLYKMGAGSVPSLIAFCGLLIGSAGYAEIHPWWAVVTENLAVFGPGVTVPQALGLPTAPVVALAIAVGAIVLWRWTRRDGLADKAQAEGYVQPWVTAVVISVVGLASYVAIGMPMGITTSYAKMGAIVESLVAPAHVAELAYFQAQPLHYLPPFGDRMVSGGAGPALDGIAAIQYPLVVGVVSGAFVSAILLREWRLYFNVPLRQYVSVLLGGVLLGFASRLVPGCNVWHLWGGIPILAGQSILYLLGLVPGTWIGSWLLLRFVLKRETAPAQAMIRGMHERNECD